MNVLSLLAITIAISSKITANAESPPMPPVILSSTITSDEGRWGEWSNTVYCGSGSFATGYWLKSQEDQGPDGDDTAANSFCLICDSNKKLCSNIEGKFGEWESKTCPSNSHVIGFRTKVVTKHQGGGHQGDNDDTSINKINIGCNDSLKTKLKLGKTNYGVWADKFSFCPKNQLVCGFSQRVEVDHATDISSLNAVKLECCDAPENYEECLECKDGIPECESEECTDPEKNPLCLEFGSNGCDKCDCDSFMKSNNHICVDCKKAITGCVTCLDKQGCIQCDYKNNWEWFWDHKCKIGRCRQHVE